VRIALGGVAHKPWPRIKGRGSNCAADRRPNWPIVTPRSRNWPTPGPLRDNGFKVELATRALDLRSRRSRRDGSMSIVEEVKGVTQAAMMTAMAKLVPLAPDSWIPGGVPDPLIRHKHGLIGTPVSRLDGPLQGAGRRAVRRAEVTFENMVYAALVYGTIASGRIATLGYESRRGRTWRRARDDASQCPAPEKASGIRYHAHRRRRQRSARSCRTTACTGTASRSRSCSPKRRSRRIMPHH